jgi:trigger factor
MLRRIDRKAEMAETHDDSIRVQTTEESSVVRRVEVEIAAPRVRKAYDRAYRELAKSARVRGFRPGKVPRSVLERLYGASVAEQLEQTLVSETLADALELAGLQPVSEPAVDAEPPRPDEAFRYAAHVEIKPELQLPTLAGLPARKPSVEVAEEEVERELEGLRQRQAPVLEEPEGTAVAPGHIVSVDFVGRIDGEVFEGGSGRGLDVEIGAARFLPGFEEQLVGTSAGEDRELQVQFPEDYANQKLAGRSAVFAVHVNDVRRRHVPELDDEFAKDLGDFDTLEALRQRVRSDLQAMRERAARTELRRTLMDALIERTPFEVPPGLIERTLARLVESAHRRLEGQVPEAALHAQIERWREEWRERAEREVRETLLLDAVATECEIAVDDAEIDARIEALAGEQGIDPRALRQAYGEDALARAMRGQLVEDKALDFLIAEAKVEETADS